MDYEDAIKMADPNQAIKERFYQDFIKPYLTEEPSPQMYDYFLHAGYQAWRFGVKNDDIKNMLFVESICEELQKRNSKDFFTLLGEIFSEHENARMRKRESERNFYSSSNSENVETKFTNAVRHYKVFFESEFRLWGTIVYYFICNVMGIKNKASDTKSFINVASSEKLFAIKEVKTVLPKGDVKDLVKGLDNEIRNAGEGHDSYEITDSNTILLKVIDPETGKQKGSKQIELTYGELEGLIQLCRKTIWVLETGVMIYFNNTLEARKGVANSRPLKVREIEGHLSSFAYNRWFILENFAYNKKVNIVEFDLKYVNRKIGKSGEVLFSTGEKFDLIDVETSVKYREQILGIIQYLIRMILPDQLPYLRVRIINKQSETTDLEFEPKELTKLTLEKSEKNIPKLIKGRYPRGEYRMVNSVSVPYGTRALVSALLTAKSYKIVN